MAHNLHYSEKLGRYAALFANNPAWHNEGLVKLGLQTINDVALHCDMGYELDVRQLEWSGAPVASWGIFRSDTNTFFGTAKSESYVPISPIESMNFVDYVIGEMEGAHYEAAGALGNGERFWVLAKLPGDFYVTDNDEHKTYLLVYGSHDGSFALTVKLTDIRTVCQNTINFALQSSGKHIKIRHTKNAKDIMEAAKDTLRGFADSREMLKDTLIDLSRRNVTEEYIKMVMEKVFPISEKRTTRRDNNVIDVLNLFEDNDGDEIKDIRGSAYNLLNAIVEYADFHMGVKQTKGKQNLDETMIRSENAVFGSGQNLKEIAYEVITSTANQLPYKGLVTRALERGAAMRTEMDDSAPNSDSAPSLLDSILNV